MHFRDERHATTADDTAARTRSTSVKPAHLQYIDVTILSTSFIVIDYFIFTWHISFNLIVSKVEISVTFTYPWSTCLLKINTYGVWYVINYHKRDKSRIAKVSFLVRDIAYLFNFIIKRAAPRLQACRSNELQHALQIAWFWLFINTLTYKFLSAILVVLRSTNSQP